MTDLEFTDRYEALGIVPPPPDEVCRGWCEGTGMVPVYLNVGDLRGGARPADETDRRLIRLWQQAEQTSPCDDGWHFVRCPDCGGSGRRGAQSDDAERSD